jgi:hypothetical protein
MHNVYVQIRHGWGSWGVLVACRWHTAEMACQA